jgi:hypothetical protein
MRKTTSFTIDKEVLAAVKRSSGRRSVSDRVNELLKRALELERQQRLEQEAAAFFAKQTPQEREETRAFQKAGLRTLRREQ